MHALSSHLLLVTLVTPVYNGAKFLEQTIESVLAQDYPNIEYIVLDDGSTDNTSEILAKYKHRLIAQSHVNMGQSKTLNKGWAMARGQILGYLSADDVLKPNAISELIKLLLADDETVVVYPNCNLIDPYNRVIKQAVAKPFDLEALVVEQECFIGPGALFKKAAFESENGWQPELYVAPDREFWMRIGLKGRFVMHPAVLASYRMHPNSISYFYTDVKAANEYIKVIEKYYERNDLPTSIQIKKNIAFSNAHIVASRIHLRGGRFALCWKNLKAAYNLNPNMKIKKILLMMLRTLVSRVVRRISWNIQNFLFKKNMAN